MLAAAALAFAAGGCSYRLGSLFDRSDGGDPKPHTSDHLTHGLIKPARISVRNPAVPPEADLAYARAAANVVLSRKGQGASQPWENPSTGARGTVTALASASTQDGITCRDFLASYVKGARQSWLQGEACEARKGVWMVRSLKPWNKS